MSPSHNYHGRDPDADRERDPYLAHRLAAYMLGRRGNGGHIIPSRFLLLGPAGDAGEPSPSGEDQPPAAAESGAASPRPDGRSSTGTQDLATSPGEEHE